MNLTKFFDRLATKRCVVFYQSYDSYLLRNGYNDSGKWEFIGTEKENQTDKYDVAPEKKPKLADYLSYDELIISALCGISSPTHFINNGDRRNCGRINEDDFGKEADKMYPMQGIYMGLVGARFEKSGYMEYALMAVTNEQNKKQNGYGNPKIIEDNDNNNNDDDSDDDSIYDNSDNENDPKKGKNKSDEGEKEEKNDNDDDDEKKENDINTEIDDKLFMKEVDESISNKNTKIIWRAFEKFYSRKYFPLYEEVKTGYNNSDKLYSNRYFEKSGWGNNHPFLDIEMFKQRIKISLELFLFDANERICQFKELYDLQGAYCHIVGLGTGVWSFRKSVQDRIIVNVTKEIIENTYLKYISCIYFSWMDDDCLNISDDNNQCIFNKDNNNNDGNYFCKDKGNNKIIIDSGRRSPADPLEKPYDNNKYLNVAMYAWDSNSFPGNEYYHGMLSASGDPAAASCSTISYVQNSEINKEYINGENTSVYFYDPNTNKYKFEKLKDIDKSWNDKKDQWLKRSVLSIPYKREKLINNNNNNNNK